MSEISDHIKLMIEPKKSCNSRNIRMKVGSINIFNQIAFLIRS